MNYPGLVHGISQGFLWIICLTYVALALFYNVLTPIGEAPDEIAHFEYLRLVLDERRLPEAGDKLWQGHQSPLYYVVEAGWAELIRAMSGCRLDAARLPNRVNPGFPHSHNFNWLAHAGTERFTSWGCMEWSFHLLRLLSTAFTVPMILLTVSILRQAVPGSSATVAVGGMLTALSPSHVALSAMLNNDALANLLIVATTYFVIVTCRTGEPADLAKAAMLASIAVTAKLSGAYLLALVLLAPVLRRNLVAPLLGQGRSGRAWVIAAAGCGFLPILVFARNLKEWGDPFAVSALDRNLVELAASGVNPPSESILHYYAIELPTLFADGFLVAYGAVNFRYGGDFEVARWTPRLVVAGLLLSLLVRESWRQVERKPLAVLVAGFALFFLTYFYPAYRYGWLQVRYFFNQFPLISLVAALAILTLRDCARTLGLGLSDRALAGLVYAYLVGLNLFVLAQGVIGHLYRYVGATH